MLTGAKVVALHVGFETTPGLDKWNGKPFEGIHIEAYYLRNGVYHDATAGVAIAIRTYAEV